MTSFHKHDDKALAAKILTKSQEVFMAREGTAQLQLISKFDEAPMDRKTASSVPESKRIAHRSHIDALYRERNASPHVLAISQENTWASLDISLDLFKDFLDVYNVFAKFWNCIFVFSRKNKENEFEFPGCVSNIQYTNNTCKDADVHEIAYVLRRVEEHGRHLENGDSPWSIRQTAVYSQFITTNACENNLNEPKATFLLVAPSRDSKMQLPSLSDRTYSKERTLVSSQIHLALVEDSLKGWGDYMAWLEMELKGMSNRVIFTDVGEKRKRPTNFDVTFEDRQNLKRHEDLVSDLKLSDILNYENAVALKSVAHESQEESKSMTQLTVSDGEGDTNQY
ncbi:MAG: hypothetical protein Q9157_008208 [Trypethelium eluteriae]